MTFLDYLDYLLAKPALRNILPEQTTKPESGRPPTSPFQLSPNHGCMGHGWKDNAEPLWCEDDMILPVSLVDILAVDVGELLSDDESNLEYAGQSDDSSTDYEDLSCLLGK